jgi:chaperonin GroES
VEAFVPFLDERGPGRRSSRRRVERMADFKLKPLEDRILVKPSEGEETTSSGLVIPDTAKEKPQEGSVVAVGPGRFNEDGDERIPLDINVGDTVIYSKYGGTEVKVDGEEYLILSGRDVLAVLTK